jgi:hypothetical protein
MVKLKKSVRKVARKDSGYRAVHRPTDFGNPFDYKVYGRRHAVALYKKWLDERLEDQPHFLDELYGEDIGCFCPEDTPEDECHAHVILGVINSKTCYDCKRRADNKTMSGWWCSGWDCNIFAPEPRCNHYKQKGK